MNTVQKCYLLILCSIPLLQESVDILIRCVSGHIGFSEGKPIAAFTIYKCLLNWKSFEAEKTNVFDHLIQMIGSSIEVIAHTLDKLVIWLSYNLNVIVRSGLYLLSSIYGKCAIKASSIIKIH